jgi:8-oxo-dGTP pyrophosphatase MutT (NUDIX family)
MKAAGSLILAASTDRVLLLRRADGQGWDQPGGMMEEDEDEPAATACRELDEETGLAPMLVDCLDSFVIRRLADGRHVTYMPRAPERWALEYTVFVCTFREEFEPTLSAEHTASGWFDLEALPEGVHPGTALAIDVLRRKGF